MKKYTAFLIPQHDLIIRDPITKVIMLKTGEVKPLVGKEGRYWNRRLRDGSVKIVEDYKAEKKIEPKIEPKIELEEKVEKTIRRKPTKKEND